MGSTTKINATIIRKEVGNAASETSANLLTVNKQHVLCYTRVAWAVYLQLVGLQTVPCVCKFDVSLSITIKYF
jgi:hypothetical protein